MRNEREGQADADERAATPSGILSTRIVIVPERSKWADAISESLDLCVGSGARIPSQPEPARAYLRGRARSVC